MLDAIASPYRARSLSAQARHRRMALFTQLIAPLPRPVSVLDVGGSDRFWHTFGADILPSCQITLLNLGIPKLRSADFTYLAGDGCDLHQFDDGQYDMVFSNSVIEHVGDFRRQTAMANEVRRVGKGYFVQTPAREFPIEPHYRLPLVQFLPPALQRLTAKIGTTLHYYPPRFAAHSESIRLLTEHEMRRLFPDGALWEEPFGPLTKSYVAYKIARVSASSTPLSL